MSATTLLPRNATGESFRRTLTRIHDAWMTDADRILGRMTQWDATFWGRWEAVIYLREQFPERLRQEQRLLTELHPFLTPELNARLWLQVDRLERLRVEVTRLIQDRAAARDMGHSIQALLEALRLWYAEIEMVSEAVRRSDLGPGATQALDRLCQLQRGFSEVGS